MRYEPMSPITFDLFTDAEPEQQPRREQIGEQSYVLRGFALPWLDRAEQICAPFVTFHDSAGA